VNEVLEKIASRLGVENVKHQIHRFDSGCVMVDIWKDESLYVIQIERERIGLSLVDENTAFDTVPDNVYKGWDDFKCDFEKIFN
jgi:hypothetical protein